MFVSQSSGGRCVNGVDTAVVGVLRLALSFLLGELMSSVLLFVCL